ncbi:DUF6270 domain-containing protein [Actinomyces viscosus]
MTMHAEKNRSTGRVTVYGSCVARDVAGEMEKRGWSVERYIARQSLISAGRPADAGDLNLSLLTSPFARRSFLSDMVGNLEAQLTAVAACTDLLLWDLTDERLGVLETAPGAFLTRSTEALTAGLYEGLTARFLELGTAEHLHLWRPALLHFRGLLERLDLTSRTVLINVPWATRTTSGESTVPSWGQTAMEANWVMTRYLDLVRQETDVRVLNVPDELVVADNAHHWGSAPFHYVGTVYSWIADELEVARSPRSLAPAL